MRAVDTNVVVRLVTGDDVEQVAIAEAFVKGGVWVPTVVLAETAWVLRANFAFDHEAIADSVQMLLDHEDIVFENANIVAAALDDYRRRPSLRFSDCLILAAARHAGHLPLGTFDKALATLHGTARLGR
jgi:predicted nucleic-acid-binding protein